MSRLIRIASAAVTLALFAASCGKTTSTSGPTGDDKGEHLLAFTTTRLSGGAEADVALYDIDTGVFRSVAGLNTSAGQSEPCLTDDGSVIVFASARTGSVGGTDLWIYDRLLQKVQTAPGLNSAVNESWPRFTHDGKRLAFVRDTLGAKRVRLFDATTSRLVPLPGLDAAGAASDDQPAPDLAGDRIAFASDRSGAGHVLVWNRVGGLGTYIGLDGDTVDTEPSLSSNGRWLAFASNRSGGAGGWDVYLYDLQMAALVRLPRCNTTGDERHPSVSADGQRIAMQARTSPTGHWSLWVYTLGDSSRLQPPPLAATSADDVQPGMRWR